MLPSESFQIMTQIQNKLQQDQILELSHYLNITYAHVSTNRYAISNLQVQLAQVNQTLVE